ncbi:MAG TPA: hypothetical protein VMV04_06655 [Thermodesulfobacteriota bacterium]|nr:hypothetical protein [Thermodesulfobacteriota bacterium]
MRLLLETRQPDFCGSEGKAVISIGSTEEVDQGDEPSQELELERRYQKERSIAAPKTIGRLNRVSLCDE